MNDRPDVPGTAPHLVLHEERLRVQTTWAPTERVVVRRRVVTEVRQVEVTLRREELELVHSPLAAGTASDAPPRPPLVIVLSEEVPVVQVQTRPYERVTVTVASVAGEQQVTETLGRERADVQVTDVQVPDSATP